MELICNPKGHAPLRRPRSVRRTSSLDTTWPDGHSGNLLIEGRCRDLVTGADLNEIQPARYDTMQAELNWERFIQKINCERVDLSALIGARGGGHLRAVLDEHIHQERVNGTPLYLLLDDISGVSLVSGWAWSRWGSNWIGDADFDNFESRRLMMTNICTGFATGNSALSEATPPDNNPQVLPLPNPQDEQSWHALSSKVTALPRSHTLLASFVSTNGVENFCPKSRDRTDTWPDDGSRYTTVVNTTRLSNRSTRTLISK